MGFISNYGKYNDKIIPEGLYMYRKTISINKSDPGRGRTLFSYKITRIVREEIE